MLQKVTARFFVAEVKRFAMSVSQAHSNGWADPAPRIEVVMRPVSGAKGPQNEQWASATPSGEIKLTVGNPEAATWFDAMLGKDIAITFEERPAAEPPGA